MKDLIELFNAFARFMDKPRNPAYAMQELMEVSANHGFEAIKQWDGLEQFIQDLEAENAELRRRLKEAGINDKVLVKEEAAA